MSNKISALIVRTDKEGVRISGKACVVIAFGASFIFAVLYILINSIAFGFTTGQVCISLKNITTSILIQLVSVCVLFIFSYFMLSVTFKKIHDKNQGDLVEKVSHATFNEIESYLKPTSFKIFARFEHVPWPKLIASSSKIDIITRYFDRWIGAHSDAFAQFFGRGGQIRIILPDEESNTPAKNIENRIANEYHSLSQRVNGTISEFEIIKAESGNKTSKFEHILSNGMIWYCAIRFDNDKLIIYPFKHSKKKTTYRPAFLIDINEFKHVNTWFEEEMNHHYDIKRRLNKSVG